MSDTVKKLTDTQVISEHGDVQILLAIRNPKMSNGIKTAFLEKTFKVTEAGNVWEVFEALIDYTFDLLITESNLPGTTCVELVKYCKKTPPGNASYNPCA